MQPIISINISCISPLGKVLTIASTVIIQEGKRATLSCIFTGYLPVNYEITWMYMYNMKAVKADGIITNRPYTRSNLLSQNGSSTSPTVQSNLTIASVKVADTGPYTCAMSGTGLKDTILLIVLKKESKFSLQVGVELKSN